MASSNLSPLETALVDYMFPRLGEDIPIEELWIRLAGDIHHGDPDIQINMLTIDNREMQMYVGAFASRINNKQDKYKIKPGELKRTYRLTLNEETNKNV